eukprot:g9615.t1
MPESQSYQQYAREKREQDWERKATERKKALTTNQERLKKAAEFKKVGGEKFKAGNFEEAIDYYKEAHLYVHDLTDAVRKDRSKMVVALELNLALCYEKQGLYVAKQIAVMQKGYKDADSMLGREGEVVALAEERLGYYRKMKAEAEKAVKVCENVRNEVEGTFVAKARLRLAVAFVELAEGGGADDGGGEEWLAAEKQLRKVVAMGGGSGLLNPEVEKNENSAAASTGSAPPPALSGFVAEAQNLLSSRVEPEVKKEKGKVKAVPKGFLFNNKKTAAAASGTTAQQRSSDAASDTAAPVAGGAAPTTTTSTGDESKEDALKDFSKALFKKQTKPEAAMLYADVEEKMKPVREKLKHEDRVLDLERELHNIVAPPKKTGNASIDGAMAGTAETLDEYREKKFARMLEQEEQLNCKKKVLDKIDFDKAMSEDADWAKNIERVKKRKEEKRSRSSAILLEDNRESAEGSAGGSSSSSSNSKPASHKELECERIAKHRLKDIFLAVALEADEDLPAKQVAETLGGRPEDYEKKNEPLSSTASPSSNSAKTKTSTTPSTSSSQHCLKALISDVEITSGDCGVFRTSKSVYHPSRKSFHYWDFSFNLNFEVCVCNRGEKSYKSGREIMREVAQSYREQVPADAARTGQGHCDAPETVAKNALCYGQFEIVDFSSDEKGEYAEGELQLKKVWEKQCERGEKMKKKCEELVAELEKVVRKRLWKFVKEFLDMEA